MAAILWFQSRQSYLSTDTSFLSITWRLVTASLLLPRVGNAGGIQINARSLSLSNGAILSANSEGTGAAGNIEVTTVKEIVPARGWIFNEKGEVVLTAYDVNSAEFQRQYLRQNSAGCRAF